MDIIIVSGMSGAGKSKCLKVLEDIGYYCIDNLMPGLLPAAVELCQCNKEQSHADRLAVSVDMRGGAFFHGIYKALDELVARDVRFRLLFLDAQDDVLVNRYRETRREHPMSVCGRVSDGIAREREILDKLKLRADIVIDTSHLTAADLRQKIYDVVPLRGTQTAPVTVISFGFKRGAPSDCDVVLDVRFLPNPFHVAELAPFTGLNQEVAEYVFGGDQAKAFTDNAADMVALMLPEYIRNVKKTLVVGIGCTGGKHRSVAVAVALGAALETRGVGTNVEHRDLYKE